MPLVTRGHQHILPSQAFWKEKNMTITKSFFFLKNQTTIWKSNYPLGEIKLKPWQSLRLSNSNLEMFGTKPREGGICNYPRLPASVSATALPTLNSWEINRKHRFLAADISWGSRADTPDVIKTKPRWEAAGIDTSACPQGAMLSLHWSCGSEPHLYGTSVLSFPASFQGMRGCPRSIHPSQKWQNRAVPTYPLGAPHHYSSPTPAHFSEWKQEIKSYVWLLF